MTRVMFVADGVPLSRVRVRAGGDDLWANDEGFVAMELGVGEHVLSVEREEGEWSNVLLKVEEAGGIVIADVSVSKPTTGMFAIAQLAGVRSQSFGDRYTFERVLGRGGMGVVVKAQDALLARPVAIKMLNEEFEDNEEAQNIFLTEARSIATLAHPNLVAVYDVAMIDNRAMIVFEFVEGANLEDVFTEHERLREGEMLRVGIQLGNALAYLHGQGVIHRDLKPGNAIVQSDGTVRLIDFGLARSLETLENKGTRVRGTPAYMSPEQIVGGELGPPADMYQFGVTLYEVVAGRLPFTEGNMGFAHVHQEPPSVETFAPDLSQEVARIIDRCLSKEPDLRPTAEELVAVFEHVYVNKKHVFDGQTRAMPALHVTGAMQAITPTIGSDPGLAFATTQASLTEEPAKKRRSGLVLWGVAAAACLSLGVVGWLLARGGGDGEETVVMLGVAEVSEGQPGEVVDRTADEPEELTPELRSAVERGSDVVEGGVGAAIDRLEEGEPEEQTGEREARAKTRSVATTRTDEAGPRGGARADTRADTARAGTRAVVSGDEGAEDAAATKEKERVAPDEGEVASKSTEESPPGDELVEGDEKSVAETKKKVVPKVDVETNTPQPDGAAKGAGVGASTGEDESEKKTVRRVVRKKKVIRKKKAAVPRSF